MDAIKDSNVSEGSAGTAKTRLQYKTLCQTFDDDLETILAEDDELAEVVNSGEWMVEDMTVSSHFNPYEHAFIHSRVVTLSREAGINPDGGTFTTVKVQAPVAEHIPSESVDPLGLDSLPVGMDYNREYFNPETLPDAPEPVEQDDDEPTVEERLLSRLSHSLIFGPPKQPVIVDPETVADATADDGDVLTEADIEDTAEILAVPMSN